MDTTGEPTAASAIGNAYRLLVAAEEQPTTTALVEQLELADAWTQLAAVPVQHEQRTAAEPLWSRPTWPATKPG